MHWRIQSQWLDVYGEAFTFPHHFREGTRAEDDYAAEIVSRFFIVPFSGPRGRPHQSSDLARVAAYECVGELVLLGRFCQVEFFITPPDFVWTMIHTHEDHGYGGPYFVRPEWLVPPRSHRNPRNGRERRRRRWRDTPLNPAR